MMNIISLVIAAFIGFSFHVMLMKISFKQSTIDYKVKAYDSLITIWVKMRNQIYSDVLEEKLCDFDKLYGESQAYLGEILLVSENEELVRDIDSFNEKYYRTEWGKMDLALANKEIELIKEKAMRNLIPRMRKDIEESSVLTPADLAHAFKPWIPFKRFFSRDRSSNCHR